MLINGKSYRSLSEPLLQDYVLGDEICFYTNDVFDKYGFADGDLLSDLFYEYAGDQKIGYIYGSHEALYEIIKTLVWPKVNIEQQPGFVSTCHNPVRMYEFDIHADVLPETVYVKIEDVFKVFDQVIERGSK